MLADNAFVTEENISEALAKQLNIPYINLKYYNINSEQVRLLPENQARRFRAIALEERSARCWSAWPIRPTCLHSMR